MLSSFCCTGFASKVPGSSKESDNSLSHLVGPTQPVIQLGPTLTLRSVEPDRLPSTSGGSKDIFHCIRSGDSSVGTATGCGPDGRYKILLYSIAARQAGSETDPASYPVGIGSSFPVLRGPWRETDHLFPCNAEVKNSGAIIQHPLCLHDIVLNQLSIWTALPDISTFPYVFIFHIPPSLSHAERVCIQEF
jgi:hypothetical protein